MYNVCGEKEAAASGLSVVGPEGSWGLKCVFSTS